VTVPGLDAEGEAAASPALEKTMLAIMNAI
jgi:hypothetical protein